MISDTYGGVGSWFLGCWFRWSSFVESLVWSREGARKLPWFRFSVSPPTLASIVSRSRTASRTAFGRRLRRSPAAILDPARDRERFGLYRVGGEGVVQRIRLGAGLGRGLVVCGWLGASWVPIAVGGTL